MKLINIFKEFKGKPFMQDIPNEFAYLDFKKWAYPRRGKIKQKLQIVLDNNQSDPGTSFFRELTRIWVMWANKNSEEFSIVNPTNVGQKDFGRALAIMMKKDNLIIQKDTNKLLDLIEDYKPSHRAYNVIDKSNNDEIVAKELPRHKALELAKTNKNYMIDATDRLAENLNPEVLRALDRFIKSMAKRYDYSERDAVFAIKAAMKQRDFLDSEDEENQSIDRPNTDIQEQKIRKLIQNEIKRIS